MLFEILSTAAQLYEKFHLKMFPIGSVGEDLNQMIYKAQFQSFPATYEFDLNQFSSHDS